MLSRFDIERLPFLGNIKRPSLAGRRSRLWIPIASLFAIFVLSITFLGSSDHFSGSGVKAQELWSKVTSNSDIYLRDPSQPGKLIRAPASRAIDTIDAFANFTRTPNCNFTSLDLHDPFHPLCRTRKELLKAMSGGGRAGIDAPYSPRGCDMRWYTTAEICDILARFDQIFFIGDSMMRNLAVGAHTLVRDDLDNGPRTTFKEDPEGLDCHCEGVFGAKACIWNAAFSSYMQYTYSPESMICPQESTAFMEFNSELDYPLASGVPELTAALPKSKPRKPTVFVLGQGIWNELNETSAHAWIQQVEFAILSAMPWLTGGATGSAITGDPVTRGTGLGGDVSFPRMFVTPTASGKNKPEKFIDKQGSVPLIRFEENMAPWLRENGYDHLGVYNLTVQNTSPDGT
ncbi:MAG: hypothetical protein M1828_003469 [Chrysothrix sp. TS-e1954]|nr:MAG: hypothetical protein M1828_003469 [Chrysothrix sp. TS-e1954]